MNSFFSVNSTIVSATLLLLVLFSIAAWSIALYKLKRQLQGRKRNRTFLLSFWAAKDWNQAEQRAMQAEGDIAALAQAGFAELKALNSTPQNLMHTGAPKEVVERQLRQQVQNLQRHHERGLSELASIGSTAPFIGLFGTVWGIMHALKDIGASGTASLDVVAGPIGEALIATAIGIATALPAVLAYNYFLRGLRVHITELENFALDFMRLAHKHNFKG